MAWELDPADPPTPHAVDRDELDSRIVHAVDGDGGSVCDAFDARQLVLIEDARWSSDLPGVRCRPCGIFAD